MTRDAEATRQRIFGAATAEFAARGVAGARIDRIAEAAGANKQLIYAYFGNKQALFDAVVTRTVTRFLDEVPFDAENLPEFAVAAFEFFTTNPEIVRLGSWHTLELEVAEHHVEVIDHAVSEHMRALKQAQTAGKVDTTIPARELFALVISIASSWAHATPEIAHVSRDDPRLRSRRRAAVRESVTRLVQPQARAAAQDARGLRTSGS